MKRLPLLALAFGFVLLLSGCAGNKQSAGNAPAQDLFATAQLNLQNGAYREAITNLEALDNQYPFGIYSTQVQLDLIYAYYKSHQLNLALAAIDRFMKLNPTYKNLDYVLYMRGLTDSELSETAMMRIFNIDLATRDVWNLTVAFRDFNNLIVNYPNSPYAADALARMVAIKNTLATHELAIIKYYTTRSAYVAVINRVEGMLQTYPDTQATRQALPYMVNAYNKLGLTKEAQKTQQLLQANNK